MDTPGAVEARALILDLQFGIRPVNTNLALALDYETAQVIRKRLNEKRGHRNGTKTP